MLTGTTSTGFTWNIEEDALDDMELLDGLVGWENGDQSAASSVCLHLLGKEQRAALYEHLRGVNGRVKATQVLTAVNEILVELRDGPKS